MTILQGQVNVPALVSRIRNEFPELEFGKATLSDEGEDHAVVLLDDRWVFRFPRTAKAAARGASERRLLSQINARAKVATPNYEKVARAGDFSGYRMIPGVELSEEAFEGLTHSDQEHVLREIGDFLRLLHAQPVEMVSGQAGDFEDAVGFVALHAERRERLAAGLGANLMKSADRFYEALPAAVATSQRVVIHRDFTEDHILLHPTEARLAGIIDFTDAGLGDPAFDFTFLWSYGLHAPEIVARSYGSEASTPALLARSMWWFTRYRIDQVWWSISGARDYDASKIMRELESLFDTLGV